MPGTASALSCVLIAGLSGPAWSQTAQPALQAQAQATPRPATQGAPAQTAAKAAPAAAAAPAGDAGLKQRVEQLEEQLVDLQVVIGTLESLARNGGGAAALPPAPRGGAAMSGADSTRIDAMETQLRALSAQIDQLSAEMRGGRPAPRTEVMPPAPAAGFAAGPAQAQVQAPAAPPPAAFGPKTVTSDQLDPIGGLIESTAPQAAPPASGTMRPDAFAPSVESAAGGAAPAPAAGGPGNAKQAYETAYSQLLRQDYGAAQLGFTEFLKQYPRDTLAPDALYWLGETHFVQQNYNDAAEAFDLVTSSFGSSAKAPDAQIRRAMSLAQAGKKDQACAAFRQFSVKFPNARATVKTKADAEKQRAGCA